jgi:cysteinyl-tRNA synthetase
MHTVWNTLHRQEEPFEPLNAGKVGLYNCGPTVYNPLTIGNLRAYTFVDVLKRSLRLLGFSVTHVMNITDVGHLSGDVDEGEDKVQREAVKRGKTAWDIAKMYEEMALHDIDRMHIERPDVLSRATEHIAEQIALVEELEKKGFTYRITDGIYFDTSKFATYGALSGQPLEEKEEGARVTANPEKRHPTDFALWKFSDDTNGKRHMEWPSPWGIGFPGWHVECSAMSTKYLGQPFDIHAGGIDLVPVHHENEIAQSEAAHGKPLARYWLHNEFLMVDGRRMGKSEGNAYTLDDLIAKGFDPLAYRYYCLGTHYRSKLNFTWEGLSGAQQALKKLRASVQNLAVGEAPLHAETMEQFRAALENDVNTPKALAVAWTFLSQPVPEAEKRATLLAMDEVFGLGLSDLKAVSVEIPASVTALAEARKAARVNKEWAKSDELRAALLEQGWVVEDGRDHAYTLKPV